MDEVFKKRDDSKNLKVNELLKRYKLRCLSLGTNGEKFKQGITAHGVKTKRPLLRQQVRPSKILGKLFYNLPNEKQTPLPLIDGYIACLRRYESNMVLLGTMNPRRPFKDIEKKRRRNNEYRRGDTKDFSRKESNRHLYNDQDKDRKNNSFGTRPSVKPNYFKDSPTALVMQDECLNTRDLYQHNPLQLAEEMVFKIEDLFIPQVTEEFHIKVRLIEEYVPTKSNGMILTLKQECRLAEANTKNHSIGFQIYGQTFNIQQIYKIADVDSPGEGDGENIYIVQIKDEEEAEEKIERPPARINQIINQVISNQKIKDTVFDLTRQFYHYGKWADWLSLQETKNLKENKKINNPKKKNKIRKNSPDRGQTAMVTQEVLVLWRLIGKPLIKKIAETKTKNNNNK
ncbi:hypothetical protein H8356DRAFT_1322295 [Neocallimastix lanati (nom. inval.)]|nr:hypothetical protein H8356DRAFT_1322295 [Neocallimastix sp. JGI-2020a]